MSKRLVTFQIDEDLYARFSALVELGHFKKGSKISELIENYVNVNEKDVSKLRKVKREIRHPQLFADIRLWLKHVYNIPQKDLFQLYLRAYFLTHIGRRAIQHNYLEDRFEKYEAEHEEDFKFLRKRGYNV